jgi:hypothetical protein
MRYQYDTHSLGSVEIEANGSEDQSQIARTVSSGASQSRCSSYVHEDLVQILPKNTTDP